jgi:hypothetical protein
MLASKIEPLTAELLPAGKREAGEWRIGSVAGEAGKSMGVKLTGPKAGLWSDFAGGPAGDALDLIAHVFFRGEIWPAYTWALAWLGITGDAPAASPRQGALPREMAAKPRSSGRERTESARRLWMEAGPPGEIVEAYFQSRNLTSPDGVDCLRYHPSCPLGPGQRFPVMIALMVDPVTNEPCGIHRTPLLPDGKGRPAGIEKKMMGNAGIVRLSDEGYDNGRLGIAEGIETALSVIQGAAWRPVWATCSAGGIERFPVLRGIDCLTIFADHDLAGIGAAQSCANRWIDAGREAKIIAPKRHGDWNDAVRSSAA